MRIAPELRDRVALDDPVTARLLEIIACKAGAEADTDGMFVERTLDLLCLQLFQCHADTNREVRLRKGGLAGWQQRRVADFIDANAHHALTLEDLAASVNLSRFHFCVAFKQSFGETPYTYLLRLRMDRAMALLADRTLSVTEIALAAGYEQHSSFTAAFRNAFGQSPSAFRRAL